MKYGSPVTRSSRRIRVQGLVMYESFGIWDTGVRLFISAISYIIQEALTSSKTPNS